MDYRIQKLREACKSQGAPPLSRLSIAASTKESYLFSDVQFLEQYLPTAPESAQILILQILCERSGHPILDYYDRLTRPSVRLMAEMIRIAELQKDPMTIASLAQQDRRCVHLGILALKRIGHPEFTTQLLLTGDEELSKLTENL